MARGPFLAGLVRRTGVSGCVAREIVHVRRQFRAVSRRAGKGTHSVYIRAQSTHQKLCSAAQGQHAEYLFVSCLVPGRSRWRLA